MWKRYVFLVLFLVVIFNGMVWAIPLKVVVNNATTGDRLSEYPFDIEILDEKGIHISKRVQLKTNKKGVYEGSIDLEEKANVMAAVSYRGVTYRSLPENKDGKVLSFNISVYEITDRADNLSIPYRTMVLTPHNDNTLQVFEVIIVKNTGNRTYVGSFNDELKTDQVLFIPLPMGYKLNQVVGLDTTKILTYNGGIVTQEAIVPGEREIILGYFLRSDTGYFDLTLYPESRGPHPDRFNLLLSKESNWKLKVSDLEASGITNFYGREFKVWTGTPGSFIKASLYSPIYKSVYGGWLMVLLAAMVVSGLVVVAGRSKIKESYRRKEIEKLKGLLENIDKDAGSNSNPYLPFIKVLKSRLKTLAEGEQQKC